MKVLAWHMDWEAFYFLQKNFVFHVGWNIHENDEIN